MERKRYVVTYTAVVLAVDEDDACERMLDGIEFETSAVLEGEE